MATTEHPRPDGTVRLAQLADAEAIARVQAAALSVSYRELLPAAAVAHFDEAAARVAWTTAISAPPTNRHRVFVALSTSDVVGFAATAPGSDADLDPESDAEILALHVDPAALRQGHGSRLMHALADHARDDGFARLVMWVFAADDALRGFLNASGWAPDGSTRDLDTGELAHQVRLHTSIAAVDIDPGGGLIA
ncbi:MAG TPA: GNAT family N-acetyltransferase [Acidothermaceae bacterium]